MTIPIKPPVTFSEIPPEWPEVVREIIHREGNAVRANPLKPVIEIKSTTTNRWHPLALPGGGSEFASFTDRNLVMARIQGENL